MKLIKSILAALTISMIISTSALAYNEPVDKNIQSIIRNTALNTVVVEINYMNTVIKTGTGFVIDNGFILTNRHIIENLGEGHVIYITYPKVAYDIEGNEMIIRGRSVKTTVLDVDNDNSDLAVLQPTYKRWFSTHLNFENEGSIKVGDAVSTVGMPIGEWNWSYATGVIQNLSENSEWTVGDSKTTVSMVSSTIMVKSGNSGAAVVNSKGNVVGIVRGRYDEDFGNSLLVQMKSITKLIERNKEKLSVDLPMLRD